MLHHGSEDYRVAVDATAKRFQADLDAIIQRGRTSAVSIIDRVASEMPNDRIIKSRVLTMKPMAAGGWAWSNGDTGEPMHRHAVDQLAERLNFNGKFFHELEANGQWGRELAAENFNRLLANQDPKKFLVRSVQGVTKGFLSDSYRRMDSRPILDSFARACGLVGATPVEGVGGDLRWEIKALLSMVFRPGGDEVVAFGVSLSNSDFGCGALSLRLFWLRIFCTNYGKLEEQLRQIHLGKRLDDSIEFSAKTYALDTKAMASATHDVVRATLSPKKINATVELITKAMAEKIDVSQAMKALPKMGLHKGEVESVEETFRNGGIEQLPPGDNTYRLSNAISWVAKKAETAERRLELEQVAGALMLKAA